MPAGVPLHRPLWLVLLSMAWPPSAANGCAGGQALNLNRSLALLPLQKTCSSFSHNFVLQEVATLMGQSQELQSALEAARKEAGSLAAELAEARQVAAAAQALAAQLEASQRDTEGKVRGTALIRLQACWLVMCRHAHICSTMRCLHASMGSAWTLFSCLLPAPQLEALTQSVREEQRQLADQAARLAADLEEARKEGAAARELAARLEQVRERASGTSSAEGS